MLDCLCNQFSKQKDDEFISKNINRKVIGFDIDERSYRIK